ncbi:bifunctional diaminohydroxyphosphoribosylaminopyrimidine deaminase/5-amino-6-(5-phosphoribosylamino)uracil reductase RibD [Okeania sp. SIO2B3]|uniref:bifunctional diaminohydroxyphosphoribosylaminopyrimidine deaminase/5-amino-6-(5-phosphoribosylamino)uracil reductase RibD n=1 Tax=Okeania sp. SIO2B3 TaxID=2607784 RepID=UPI0013BF6A34|nr:bifunctional diaminohydroxyphosphoribosylaminopyrimidine deaminase/5-amino-6-(5-phosphoribosylamino)uracil reductase RibD [Okeania sp. SIO2B3]NET42031.1 bifunctional diaminohydroxyphosphoribosylaminopyrimidine deaminase/5-amino-6-(5-phosphoribosylamino)uracil reductase RibD [Okeania sp. SIO2B3]
MSEFDRSENQQKFDQVIMGYCLELAQRALGRTAPNPMVGCAIAQNGQIVGKGFHPGAGHPHAEVFALKEAGEKAKGATVYVSLEPCSHYGRTPPCTEALIAAGVAKVVVGMIDPNPLVAGSGIAKLREAGIQVVVGVLEAECRQLNEAFIHRILHQKPFGILKYAMTLDGKIATTTGHSAWVTSPAARSEVHKLRVACDVVIIGGNTVRRDNPLLTSRSTKADNPLRVVMSRGLDLPTEANLWDVDEANTLVFTEVGSNQEFQQYLRQKGVEVVEVSSLTPAKVMENLYDRGFLSVLWECGGTLAARAIADGVVQKILAFIAPKIIGGQIAPSPVGDLGLVKMTDAVEVENMSIRAIGCDYLLTGYIMSG